ncbi:hypothetical protein J2S09_004251 [Bacillus fengqiuensis]|nr:hypothetical protein [Bacillus fengqiuensis]
MKIRCAICKLPKDLQEKEKGQNYCTDCFDVITKDYRLK